MLGRWAGLALDANDYMPKTSSYTQLFLCRNDVTHILMHKSLTTPVPGLFLFLFSIRAAFTLLNPTYSHESAKVREHKIVSWIFKTLLISAAKKKLCECICAVVTVLSMAIAGTSTCGAFLNIDPKLWLFRQTSPRLPDVVDPLQLCLSALSCAPLLWCDPASWQLFYFYMPFACQESLKMSFWTNQSAVLWVSFMLTIQEPTNILTMIMAFVCTRSYLLEFLLCSIFFSL